MSLTLEPIDSEPLFPFWNSQTSPNLHDDGRLNLNNLVGSAYYPLNTKAGSVEIIPFSLHLDKAGGDFAQFLLPSQLISKILSEQQASPSIPSTDSLTGTATASKIIFIDPTVPDYQSLIAGVEIGAEIFIFNSANDGVEQITQILSTRSNISSLHIVSHGSSGNLQLGNTPLNLETLSTSSLQAERVKQWANALTLDADILLYGCEVAAGEPGATFVRKLGELTGTDIAASNNLTGSTLWGGDWKLEVATGEIETDLAFRESAIASYQSVLATFDVAAGDVSGLINAINAANNEAANPGLDTINLLGGTYSLTSANHTDITWGNTGLPVITSQIFINGNNSVINGNNSDYRILRVNSGGNLTLNDVTLANAKITNASASFGGDAAALLNDQGTVTIQNSTISGNNARDDGGGIVNFDGTMTISNSTISGNTASGSGTEGGGGIENDGANAKLNLINTTVSGNTGGSEGGGGIRNRNNAQLNITNNTIAFNSANSPGGGIYNLSGSVTVKNSIVIGNTATINSDVSGTFTSNNANIIGDTTGSSGFGSDITGVAAATVLNTTLANNGGSTQTHALIAGSAAIDAANNADAPSIDQRGGERVGGVNSGTNADIGAYEATSSYVVTNTNDDNGIGSLRSAINFANINVNPVTANAQDTIRFNIGSGAQTIAPTSALPTITQSIIIDGTTQPGFATTPIIELDGTSAGVITNGLIITAGNSTVRGLVINRFTLSGILLQTNGNNIIEGNYIGTDVNGTVDRGNAGNGILIDNSPNNTIGGTTAAQRNIISGNNNSGIYVVGNNATGNQILGNYIGTNATGTASVGNSTFGGVLVSAPNNIIGGTATGAGNLISGNTGSGIRIGTSSGTGNQILGNLIGTDVNGTSILGNSGDGVITIASNTIIGGTTAAARNIISGNNNGVVSALGAANNQVQGNYIGTDITGNVALGNTFSGINISSPNNTIGGTVAGARNIISGNNSDGVSIGGNNATGNQILGNYIGTKADGTSSLNNGNHGIAIFSNGANNAIGSTTAGNTIAFSGADGVSIQSSAGTGNSILGNSIFSNTGLGIDLGNDGVQANDIGDADTGANNLQNYPVLTGATSDGTTTSVAGTFNGAANTTFTLQFFSNATSDPTGYGEGQTFLGSTTVTTDTSGNASFTVNIPTAVTVGQYITATATDPSNNTSEFSIAIIVTVTPPPLAVVINEVAWMGTQADTTDEWIELYNPTASTIDLSNWTLVSNDGSPAITIPAGKAIAPGEYFLLERTVDTTVNSIPADLIYTGALVNTGETLILKSSTDNIIDTANGDGGLWPAGVNFSANARFTMERISATAPDTDANWRTNDGVTQNGKDAGSNPIHGTPKSANSLGNIPSLSINDVTVTEGNSGIANATFTVTLSSAYYQNVTVNYATTPGTATASNDYTTTNTTPLTFAPGETIKTITVQVQGDTFDETDETFTVNLSNPTNATILDNQGIGTITDDDVAPTISITDVTVTEGNSGTTNANFIITLSTASGQDITVDYFTANGTATDSDDYNAIKGTLTLKAGETKATLSVPVVGDTLDEIDENFFLNLTNPTNTTLLDNQGVGTITDDDAAPTISISDVSLIEGNSGITNAVFTVTLNADSSQIITVDYATANGSATAPDDYKAITTTPLSFNPGETTKTITVQVKGDTLDEIDENFFVNLNNATNATIIDNQGIGTITDDDATPTISITDVTITEGNSGTSNAVFTVNLSAASTQTISVDYDTANGSATAPDDYNAIPTTTLTFAPGETAKTITVQVQGDTVDETDETFSVNLVNSTNGTISDNQGIGTITDDDATPTISITDVTVTEGNSGTNNAVFTVSLSAASTQVITVDYATANNSATTPDDYTAFSTTKLTFNPGETTKTISIAVVGDTVDENDESFFVNLSNPTNAAIADNQGIGTIIDDDLTPTPPPNPPSLPNPPNLPSPPNRPSEPNPPILPSPSNPPVLPDGSNTSNNQTGNPSSVGTHHSFFNFVQYAQLVASLGGNLTTLFFDENYYRFYNPDVDAAIKGGIFRNGLEHFLQFGDVEKRNPSATFDHYTYLANHSDVATAVSRGIIRSGFAHFIQFGLFEKRDINTLVFDEGFYLARNFDVKTAVSQGVFTTGYEHFMQFGRFEGRTPNILLNHPVYLAQNQDVAAAVEKRVFRSGVDHFVQFGVRENRNLSSLFSNSIYLVQNQDVAKAVVDGIFHSGFEHYIHCGVNEGRSPKVALFDHQFYLNQNPDVVDAINSGIFNTEFDHFLPFGQQEERTPSLLFNNRVYLVRNQDVAKAVAEGYFRSGFDHLILFGRAEGRAA